MPTNPNQNQDNFKRGTAELLVLYLLTKEDLYGYQISQAFEEKSLGAYTILEGSLYPVLYRLSAAGYISEYTKKVGVRRTRKYYHLEPQGREYYEQIRADYETITLAINRIMDNT
ncbi:MAG: PadR family transcriptional regulator [Clostridia bacterium]|nr:PadR family transcriptional regulator [Clostridia bacterium]